VNVVPVVEEVVAALVVEVEGIVVVFQRHISLQGDKVKTLFFSRQNKLECLSGRTF
jgi:hypothetical protein